MSKARKQHVYAVLVFGKEPLLDRIYKSRKLAELRKAKLEKNTDNYVAILRKGVESAPRAVLSNL
jgi:hypothetical protein